MSVLLFDIDGTLINSGNAGRMALDVAFDVVHELRDAGRGFIFDGKTDPRIYDEICANHGIAHTPQSLQRFLDRYVAALTRIMPHAPGATLLPGVSELLRRAESERIPMGLLTGNIRRGARIKLNRFDLNRFFTFGAFGDDAETRPRIAAIALERGRGWIGDPSLPEQSFVVIGDTPHDVNCGKACGMRTLGVATGSRYSVKELSDAGADLALPDMSDTRAIMDWISNPR